jgi:Reverse transcriptase (RNA-dependent DNA polymerase)
VDYKILTEIMMRRLVKALSPGIGMHQSAFVKNRLIDDNICTVQLAIARSRVRQEDLGILFLDQEKAYDRVSHDFMWEALGVLGILQKFVSWVRALYRDATVNLYINGYQSRDIPVKSGVRQGDPISCPLIVAANAGD